MTSCVAVWVEIKHSVVYFNHFTVFGLRSTSIKGGA